jgi:hypothetical protein
MSSELDALAPALAAFQAEVPVVAKKQTAKIETQGGRNYTYTYADLATIAPVVMPLLAKHGLSFTALPTGSKGDRGPVLRGMLLHTSGQRLTGELPITGRTPQEIGSSLTYGRRYLLGCLTGVVTDDDDDGSLATRATRKTTKNRPPGVDPQPPVAPALPIQRKPRAGVTEPAPAGESPHGSPGSGPAPGPDDTPIDPMRRALFVAIGETLGGNADRAERLALCSAVVGRYVESSTDLSRAELSRILNWLDAHKLGQVEWAWNPATGAGEVFTLDPNPPDEGA